MSDRTAEWDRAISSFLRTGKMTEADRHLALNSCPTCCDTGMDEGVFCEDCPTGQRLSRQAQS